MTAGYSPLATLAKHPRDDLALRGPPFGVCLHTTGDGLPAEALRFKMDPLADAERRYCDPDAYCPHYTIHGKRIVQIADERLRAQHIGRIVDGVDRRRQYMNGQWEMLCPADLVARWRGAWPGKMHPYQLFPSQSPNGDYVGVELVPISPPPTGLRFTDDDHETAARLCADIGTRWQWPDGWWLTGRLVGHEDVGLIDRHDAVGGWDPGHLRRPPVFFDFPRVRRRIAELWGQP